MARRLCFDIKEVMSSFKFKYYFISYTIKLKEYLMMDNFYIYLLRIKIFSISNSLFNMIEFIKSKLIQFLFIASIFGTRNR